MISALHDELCSITLTAEDIFKEGVKFYEDIKDKQGYIICIVNSSNVAGYALAAAKSN